MREDTAGAPGRVQLTLLGRFTVAVDGSALPVARTGQRLLARIALADGVEDRGVLAGTLWPDHTELRAQANLRGAVWRLPEEIHRRLAVGVGAVAFDGDWDVDLHWAEQFAAAGDPYHGGSRGSGLPAGSLFRSDLLPDWDESWLLMYRERYRQLRLHALENLAELHLRAGRSFAAVDCALLAVATEPLRESAQRLLVRAHLAAGNRAAAGETLRAVPADAGRRARRASEPGAHRSGPDRGLFGGPPPVTAPRRPSGTVVGWTGGARPTGPASCAYGSRPATGSYADESSPSRAGGPPRRTG